MFDHAVFVQGAFQLRDFANGYAALGLDAEAAAAWANRGFLPGEASIWLAEAHTPQRASYWANKYTVSPAEARERDSR
jgi:hypothetical protein